MQIVHENINAWIMEIIEVEKKLYGYLKCVRMTIYLHTHELKAFIKASL